MPHAVIGVAFTQAQTTWNTPSGCTLEICALYCTCIPRTWGN